MCVSAVGKMGSMEGWSKLAQGWSKMQHGWMKMAQTNILIKNLHYYSKQLK